MRARLLLFALLLAACSNSAVSADDSFRRGLAALDAGRPRIARIELMNAVQARPGDARTRIALARAYLALGDGAAAEAELARVRGIDPAELRHLAAHALLLQSEPQRAITEAEQAAPAHMVYAARMRGRAWLALGDTAAAAQAFNDALAVTRDDGALWTDIARFRRASGELAGAVGAADRAVELDPDNVEALTLHGELARGQYGLAAAIPWFDRALEIDPNHVPALLERAATLGDLGRMRAMLADTRKVLSLESGNRVAFYLQAMLAARARNFELAHSLYRRTGGALENQPAAMLLASAIEIETGNAPQAIDRLTRLVGMQPDNRKARRLLASAQWRHGDALGTIATLRPLADLPDADAYSLTLIGEALWKQGEDEEASAYLARAARPHSASTLLAGPVDDVALAAMRQSAASSPNDAGVQIPLIRALLARGIGDEALQRARYLQSRNPGAPDAHILVGDALGIQGNFAAAAQEYRKAANIAFSEPVAMRLIEALRRSGNERGAAQVLELFLQQNPRNVPAQLLAAGSFLRAGQWDRAIAVYEQLRQGLGDRDATLLNNLAWAYSEKGVYAKAIPLAKLAWQLDRDNPATTDTLGWLLFKSGIDKAQGLALMQQAARGAPTDAQIRAHLVAAREG